MPIIPSPVKVMTVFFIIADFITMHISIHLPELITLFYQQQFEIPLYLEVESRDGGVQSSLGVKSLK